jgi:alpha-beta hydrolase superfamily lysophospholipase
MVRSLFRWLLVAAGSAVLGLLLLGLVVYAHYLAAGPELQPWHLAQFEDFTAGRAGEVVTLEDYLRLEERLFADLEARVYQPPLADRELFNRYRRGSRSDPGTWPVNWNRSFHLQPAAGTGPRGVVLLLHGLTDSPYSLRAIGEHLAARGHEVVGLRLPGHGTAPSGLLTFQIEDMQAAVRLAARDLAGRDPPGRPFFIVGYSNGAALALDYAVEAIEGGALPRPAGLVLISPAIAVSKLAVVGRFKTGLSSLPGFERAAWENITLEYDPYKYNSFTLHAGGETFRLTRRLARRLARLAGGRPIQDFPPLLVFLSTVDSTVKAEAVTATLLDRLAPDGHELVLFDINRYSGIRELLVEDPGRLTAELGGRSTRGYALSVISNASGTGLQVVERRAPAGSVDWSTRPIGIAWPPHVFSLSHVALPFPPDDPLYGYEVVRTGEHVQLGAIEVRGENGVLAVPASALTRQRSNPFHAYLLDRLDAFLEAPGVAPHGGRSAVAAGGTGEPATE